MYISNYDDDEQNFERKGSRWFQRLQHPDLSCVGVNSEGPKFNSFNQNVETFRVWKRQDHLDKFPTEMHYFTLAE